MKLPQARVLVMKDYKVQYKHYFCGEHTTVVQAEDKESAIAQAKAQVLETAEGYGGNVDRNSFKVVAQKNTDKPKWKEVRS